MVHAERRVLERVRKLLERAEHPATPAAEAEACSLKAAELMSRHLIDEAMLDVSREDTSTPVRREVVVSPPYSIAKAVLLDEIASAFRVRVAIGGDRGRDGRRCTLVGFSSDVAMCDLLFTSLLLQASTAMVAKSRGRPDARAFRRAFLFGYASTIGRRLRQMLRQVEDDIRGETPGTALALADRRTRVDAAFDEQFPRLRALRTTASSPGGLVAGTDAGAGADLSVAHRRVGDARRQVGD